MTDLTIRHQRTLASRFKYIDSLLSEIEAMPIMTTMGSPFAEHQMDLKPEGTEIVERHIARVRTKMCNILEQKGIQIDRPAVGIVKAMKTHLRFIDLAIDELGPKHMKGYGELSAEAEDELIKIIEDLKRLVKAFQLDLNANRRE